MEEANFKQKQEDPNTKEIMPTRAKIKHKLDITSKNSFKRGSTKISDQLTNFQTMKISLI